MSGGAVLIAKQNRLMRRFREAGAVDPQSARSLEALDVRDSWVFRSLVAHGVFRETEGGEFWLDGAGAAAFLARRRKRMLLAAVIVAAILALVFSGQRWL